MSTALLFDAQANNRWPSNEEGERIHNKRTSQWLTAPSCTCAAFQCTSFAKLNGENQLKLFLANGGLFQRLLSRTT